MPRSKSRKVVLVGWDAADWKIISPLMDAGRMPALQSLVNRGVMGNLSTLTPPLSPMLWTSIATGRNAADHGILGFLEPSPITGDVQPASSTSRRVKTVWNILNQSGYSPQVVSWLASHPAEPVRGVVVSDAFHKPTGSVSQPWPVAQGSVNPPRLAAELAALRMHPGEITVEELVPFVPNIARLDAKTDRRLVPLVMDLAACTTTHAVATSILEQEPWDFFAVYYDTIDRVSHHFMPYHPPRLDGVSEEDFELYSQVVTGIYRFHDMMLSAIMQLAGDDATIMVVSDHGFHSDHLRPPANPAKGAEAPLSWHRHHGVFVLAGPGIRQDELIFGAGLLDIAPTLLTLYGLPVGQDMPGRPLIEVFEEPPPLERIPSWEDVDGEAGLHPPDQQLDPSWDHAAAIQQLVDLGYVDKPSDDAAERVRVTRAQQQMNLARSLLADRQPAKALELLERLSAEFPGVKAVAGLHALALLRLNRHPESKEVLLAALPDASDRALPLLLEGNFALSSGNLDEAVAALEKAERDDRPIPRLRVLIAAVYMRGGRWSDAERTLRRAIEHDPHSHGAHIELARALIGQSRFREAADSALDAVGLQYDEPLGHFYLGHALGSLGYCQEAVDAFKVSLKLKPDNHLAHLWLAHLYAQGLGEPELTAEHRLQAEQISRQTEARRQPDAERG